MSVENSIIDSSVSDGGIFRYSGHSTIGEILLADLDSQKSSRDEDNKDPHSKLQYNGGGTIDDLVKRELEIIAAVNIPVVSPPMPKVNDRRDSRYSVDNVRSKRLRTGRATDRARVIRPAEVIDLSETEGLKDFRFCTLAWRKPDQGNPGYLSSDRLNMGDIDKFVEREGDRIGVLPESRNFMRFTLDKLKDGWNNPGFAVELFGSGSLSINGDQCPLETYTAPKNEYPEGIKDQISVLYIHRSLKTQNDIVLIGFYKRGFEGEHLGDVLASLYNPVANSAETIGFPQA